MTNMVNIANFEQGKRSVSGLRDIRSVVMLNEQEESEIQAYRFGRHIGTKAEAVRTLIRKGLEAEKMATTGSEFGDQNPAGAATNNHQEMTDAERT